MIVGPVLALVPMTGTTADPVLVTPPVPVILPEIVRLPVTLIVVLPVRVMALPASVEVKELPHVIVPPFSARLFAK